MGSHGRLALRCSTENQRLLDANKSAKQSMVIRKWRLVFINYFPLTVDVAEPLNSACFPYFLEIASVDATIELKSPDIAIDAVVAV